ncbi:MAG TPA: response regulator transcription factor [Rhodocyclaceae bacterium]
METRTVPMERRAEAPTAGQRVLVVEDDRAMAEVMMRMLQGQGCIVEHVDCGTAALQRLKGGDFDALVLDIGLPDLDGFAVLDRLGTDRRFGVLVVSAYDRVDQRVRGLDLGADDYLVKPFAAEEFEARVRAVLRRGGARRTQRLAIGQLTVDTVGKRAWVADAALEMTAREWTVLLTLLERIGQVVGKDQLQQALAGDRESLTENAIEVYVSRLRTRLAESGVTIRTLRGFGYMIEEPQGRKR